LHHDDSVNRRGRDGVGEGITVGISGQQLRIYRGALRHGNAQWARDRTRVESSRGHRGWAEERKQQQRSTHTCIGLGRPHLDETLRPIRGSAAAAITPERRLSQLVAPALIRRGLYPKGRGGDSAIVPERRIESLQSLYERVTFDVVAGLVPARRAKRGRRCGAAPSGGSPPTAERRCAPRAATRAATTPVPHGTNSQLPPR
jgi:hypothetical protein